MAIPRLDPRVHQLMIASNRACEFNSKTAAVVGIVGSGHFVVVGRVLIKPNMIHSEILARHLRRNLPAFIVLAAWMALSVSSRAADNAMSMPMPDSSKANDLTGMSLNELYNLNVVQLNVLGGHTHCAGQIMLGYDYMHTHNAGIFEGTKEVSPQKVFSEGFGVVHTSMDMDMHMFDVMEAPSDHLTLMAMLPYMQMTMQHLKADGTRFTQSTGGIGDFAAMALWTVYGDSCAGGNRIVLNAGVSFPTGSISTKDHKEGEKSQPLTQLEYPMQLGSGTYDLLPGITYLGESENWSWGMKTLETVRLGRNDHDYRLGNQYGGSAWLAYGVTEWFAPSLRLDGRVWENITGADPALATNPTPEGRPNLRAGARIDSLFGVNFYVPKGIFAGNRFYIEGGLPVYQDLTGPQLGTAWMIGAGWTYAF
jgi:hypothetical protein